MDLITTRTQACPCPACGKSLDATSAPGATPKPGDFSFCIYCAAVMRFDAQLHLELLDIDTQPIAVRVQLRRYQALIRAEIALRPPMA